MIKTMKQFYQSLDTLKSHSDEMISVFDLVEVIDLRLKRLEDQLGIPMPDDLSFIKTKFSADNIKEDQLWPKPQVEDKDDKP